MSIVYGLRLTCDLYLYYTVLALLGIADGRHAAVLALPALLGVGGTAAAGFVLGKLLNVPFGLAVSLGISCTFGFPTTMLIPQEVSEALGRNEKEKAAILNYLLPKMLTAGFVTVTIASVLIAGFVVNML